MSVALARAERSTAEAQDDADSLAKQLEKLWAVNDRYRDHLEYLQTVLENLDCDEEVLKIDHLLRPLVGVLEDGTEVQFQYGEIDPLDIIKCDYCLDGFTCSCKADITCDYCSQGFYCDCGSDV